MLDNRMLELADYWVLVRRRGLAQPYRVEVNDFNGKVQRVPIREGEQITFQDLHHTDEDKKYLDDIKDDLVMDLAADGDRVEASEHKKKVKKAREDASRETRDKAIYDLYKHSDLSYADISDLDWVGLSTQRAHKIANEQEMG